MATTSIGGKQYPSMQEMVGIFGGFERQRLAREDLERQKAKDKAYGNYMTAQIEHMEKERELLAVKNQMLFMKEWRDQRAQMGEMMMKAAENERAMNLDIANTSKAVWTTMFGQLKPGGAETPEMIQQRKNMDTYLKKAAGWKDIDIAESQRDFGAITKPEEEATIGQKIQAYLQLAEKNPDIVAGPLGKAVGLEIPPEALDTKTAKELREDIVQINKAHERGAFETEEDYLTAVRNRLKNKTAIYEDVAMAPTAGDLSATAFSAVVGPEKILRKGTPSRDEAELAARHLTRNSPQGVRYKVIRDDPGPFGVGFERYKVIEDIPVGLESAWYEMSDEEKGTARALISRGVSAEKIIEAIRND